MTGSSGRRRGMVALILSGVFPGLGQLYNHQPVKGTAFIVAGIVLSWLMGRRVPSDPMALVSAPIDANLTLLACLLLAIWLWSVIDAWRAGSG